MIRTIDIRLNAAHPELPLPEATTYQNAPSTAFLRGVPKLCGLWQITAVSVAATFPDNSTTTRAAVLSAGDVWVCTIPACATSGRTTSGLRILADGTDENGNAVTGYVLGVADLAVATFDIAPAPGVTSYALRYFDSVPNPPHKGDVAKIGGELKYYDGTAWQVFADVDLSDYATKADATLTNKYTDWVVVGNLPSGSTWISSDVWYDPSDDYWKTWLNFNGGEDHVLMKADGAPYTALELTFEGEHDGDELSMTTRRSLSGYQLGSQADKPLASEAEAEALRTSKQDALSAQQLANIAAVPGKLDKSEGELNYGWTFTPSTYEGSPIRMEWTNTGWQPVCDAYSGSIFALNKGDESSTSLEWSGQIDAEISMTATRATAGMYLQLGTQSDRKLATAAQGALAETAVQPSALNAALPYTFNEATVTLSTTTASNDTAAVTDVVSRAINTATLGSSVTAATVTLPAATPVRARDFFVDLTIEATDAPTLTFIDPATNTTINVAFGADSLADIDTGKNAVLFTEFPNHTWLVSVKHEDFPAAQEGGNE